MSKQRSFSLNKVKTILTRFIVTSRTAVFSAENGVKPTLGKSVLKDGNERSSVIRHGWLDGLLKTMSGRSLVSIFRHLSDSNVQKRGRSVHVTPISGIDEEPPKNFINRQADTLKWSLISVNAKC